MSTTSKHPRGSEWRKWDLHLHSPGTKKNDGYKGSATDIWDEYCERIEDSDVQVFGVTDYFSADGYLNTIKEFGRRYAGSTKTFFANIELCTSDVVNKQREEVNLHVVFNPSVSTNKLEEFLSNLQTNKTDSKGRNVTAAELKSEADFECATTTREFIRDALERTFGSKAELTDHLLIFTAINNDGIRAERGAKRKAAISEENPPNDTLNWLKQELRRITDTFPGELQSLRVERERASKDVFAKKKKLLDFYTAVKQSIDREIATYRDDLRGYAISIEASLRLDSAFYEDFFRFISQAVKGSFYGSEDGKTLLRKLIEQVGAWGDEPAVFQFLTTIVDYLDYDKRPNLPEKESKTRDIFRQLREKKGQVEFYDFLFGFSYLKTKYDLKVDGKDLSELSPGERGGLLLVFYLMLDKREIPLVIDQPEDNLDNKSVYEILVTFLKKAKKRRQIIIATHNPNLAVVADAEQIIHVSINKSGQATSKNDFSFKPGAIEDPEINKLVVDILEGTLPAFDNRRLKYRKQPPLPSGN